MKKILDIILGDMSTGELGIAISFIKGQSAEKYNHLLLIPEEKAVILDRNTLSYRTISKVQTAVQNQQLISELIQSYAPDLIILFDAFTFEYAQNWTGFNMELLKKCGIPIASIDEYEYTRTNYKLDYYGVFVKKLPDLLNHCNFVFKNCPLSMPRADHGKNEYYYKALNALNLPDSDRHATFRRKVFGEDSVGRKIVFFPTSAWEVEGAYSFSCQNSLAEWLGPLLFHYLDDLKENILLFHVGKENWNLASKGKLVYYHRDSLTTSEFEECIQLSDLFVTYNVVSISLSKAVLFGIPSIVLNNQKIIEFEKLAGTLEKRPEWYRRMACEVKKVYPFRASMFGWFSFLKECLKDNSYTETFVTAPVFNYSKMMELLRTALFDSDYRQAIQLAQTNFAKEYDKIPSPEKVLDDMFGLQEEQK